VLPALLAVAWATEPLTTGGEIPLTATAPAGLDLDPATCGGCHTRVHKGWAGSQHATSFTDPAFQAAWRPWPDAWCLHCHAPLARPGGPAGAKLDPDRDLGPAATHGVSCAACHVRDGTVLAANPPGWLARKAHPIEQDTRLADSTLCAGCHDFDFQNHTPAWPMTWSDEPLQDTVDEWRASWFAEAGTGCVDCHVRGRRHRFAGGHDVAQLRDAVDLRLTRTATGLEATLTATGVGHRVPTGDPFRRLVLEVCADEACATRTGRAVFGRRFRSTATSWEMVADTTVPPPAEGPTAHRTLAVPLDGPAVHWRLWVHYADPTLDLPADLDRALLAEGPVPEPSP
jgi:hypothetical protein